MEGDLAPCFLVASPSLHCPFFHHTVVLLVDHRADGALGFVVNRESGLELGEVLEQIGVEAPNLPSAADSVLLGGPVAPQTGWVVFDLPQGVEPSEGAIRVCAGLGVSASMDTLHDIGRGDGPARHALLLGYAGWGPGQLDQEIREGSWIPVDVDPKLVFETPVDERWATALRVHGIDPARVVSSRVAEA